MLDGKLKWAGLAAFALCFVIYSITTITSIFCLTDKKTECAQNAGIMACLTSSALVALIGLGVYMNK